MTRKEKRKYDKIRAAFRRDLIEIIQFNKSSCLLIIENYILTKTTNLQNELISKHKDKELIGKKITGKFSFYDTLALLDNTISCKYRMILPESLALGDAYTLSSKLINDDKFKVKPILYRKHREIYCGNCSEMLDDEFPIDWNIKVCPYCRTEIDWSELYDEFGDGELEEE